MTKIRVLKIGGSLLARSDWPARLRTWLGTQANALNLLIVGGGEIVEAVRQLDAVHHMDAGFSHWLCIDLLSATCQIAAQLLPEIPLINHADELRRMVAAPQISDESKTCLVQVTAFYSRHTHRTYPPQLPEDWSTTSDSLAAWLALQVKADELVLFKSVAAPVGITSVLELVNLGIVDQALSLFGDDLQAMRIVKL